MSISEATIQDIPQLAKLRWDFQLEEETEQATIEQDEFLDVCSNFLTSAFNSGLWQCWIAKDGDEIISHIYLQKVSLVPKPQSLDDKYYGYVTNTYTVPEYRNKGIGGQLLQKIVDSARQENLDTLIVWPSEKSFGFYQKAGFTNTGEVLELSTGS